MFAKPKSSIPISSEFKAYYLLHWLAKHTQQGDLYLLDVQKAIFEHAETPEEIEIYNVIIKYATPELKRLLNNRWQELENPALRVMSTLVPEEPMTVAEEDILCDIGNHHDKWYVQKRHLDNYYPFFTLKEVIDERDAEQLENLVNTNITSRLG